MEDLSFNPYPHNNGAYSTTDTVAIEQAALTIFRLFWTMYVLAELACTGMALLFYLGLWSSDPQTAWLPTIIYLFQGYYLVYLKRDNLPKMLKTDKPISRWRLAVAVLGWPCHMIIVQFYADLLREESRQPAVPLDDSWFHITLVFAILRWGSVWAMAWMMTFGMSIFIQQVGWLGG